MKFVKLFEPVKVGPVTMPNRIVMPAMGLHFGDTYDFTERYKAFYRERAHGGSLENRMRFGLEVIRKMKAVAGPDLAVGIRVAGGGAAGMAFAIVAAGRGHDVTLFEKEAMLGGQVNLASAVPGKEEFLKVTASMENRMHKAGVKVRKRTALSAARMKRNAPDVLVVATGAKPMDLRVPGVDKPHVVGAWDVLKGEVPHIGKKVVIVGGNAVGCETAEYIAAQETPDAETFAGLTRPSRKVSPRP